MNDGGYRAPGRDMDVTVIEQEKVRQAAETKRKLIEEKEKTKRELANARRARWTDPTFALLVGVCTIALCLVGGITLNAWIEAKSPAKPIKCEELTDIIRPTSDARHCGPGARLETQPMPNGNVLVRCLCSPPVGDAGP